MGVIIPAGFAQASFGGRIAFDDEEAFWTMGFSVDGGFTAGIAEDLYNAWLTEMDGVSSTDFTFTSCRVKYGPGDSGPVDEFTTGSTTGLVTETTIPINTAMLVRKITGTGGRKGRGRAYMVGCLYNGILGGAGLIDPGDLATRQTAVDALHGSLEDVTGVSQLVLLHSSSDIPSTITALSVQQKVATQRRRLRP